MGCLALAFWLVGFAFFYSSSHKGANLLPAKERPSNNAILIASALWPWLVVTAFARGDL